MTLLPAVIADLISCFSIYKIFTKAKDLKWILYDKQLLCPWPYRKYQHLRNSTHQLYAGVFVLSLRFRLPWRFACERVRDVTCLVCQIGMHGLLQEPPEEHLSLSMLSFQNLYGGICLYLVQLSVKLVICRLSFVCYHCLEYVRWYTSNSQMLVLPFTSIRRNCCFNSVLVI